jgi:hypothetical protein
LPTIAPFVGRTPFPQAVAVGKGIHGVTVKVLGTLHKPLRGWLPVLQSLVVPPLAPVQVQRHCGGVTEASQVGPLDTVLPAWHRFPVGGVVA